MLDEFSLIDWIKKNVPGPARGDIGIGDDAAVLSLPGNRCQIVTTDVIVEGVDFLRRRETAEEIGHKALAVNLSDIAAMGARPKAYVAAIGLPPSLETEWVRRCHRAMARLARRWEVACIGGDISRSRQVFIAVTVLGEAAKKDVVLRSGARPGERIGVTGALGGSILGKHCRFEPRLAEAAFLVRNARPGAMIDISDGLVQDLEHLLRASGTAAELDLDRIPVSRAAFRLGKTRKGALLRSLSDGEDFELLFTVPEARTAGLERRWKRRFPGTPLSWIGTICRGRPEIRWRRKGIPVDFKMNKKGYRHFEGRS